MEILQSIILGLVQGVTEFLPISSSAHLIIVENLFGWQIPDSLSFAILLNTATLLAVIYCFWGEIKRIFVDLNTEGFSSRSRNLVICLLVGTVPASLIGFFFSDQI